MSELRTTYGGYTLDALLALANAATKGPWRTRIDGELGTPDRVIEQDTEDPFVIVRDEDCHVLGRDDMDERNYAFIASAREALPALIERIAELEREREEDAQERIESAKKQIINMTNLMYEVGQEREDFARRCIRKAIHLPDTAIADSDRIIAAVKEELAREKERP